MFKSFSIGNTAVTLNLKEEFQGGNYGIHGEKVVKIDFNQADFFISEGKFVRSVAKDYSCPIGSCTEGASTGVDNLIVNMAFASAVLEDLQVGQVVTLVSGALTVKARILTISDNRRILKLDKFEDVGLNVAAVVLLRLDPSGSFVNGDSFELTYDNTEFITLVNTNGTPATGNLTMTLKSNVAVKN